MFKSQSKLIFVEVVEKISKNGNPFKLVHLIDPENYQHLEFFADSNLKVSASANQPCSVVLSANKVGYSTSVNCLSVVPV